MDTSEKLVADFLAYRGYIDVEYEPDGNVPPDFLVAKRIAVEVRRLNQNYDAGIKTQGLEEIAIALQQKMKKLLLSFGPPIRNESWFVCFDFHRPVEPWKTLHSKIRPALQTFISRASHSETKLLLGNGFVLEILRASKPHLTFFVPGGHVDDDSGGWLITEMEKNLRICIHEKTEKIARYKSKYLEWWLVLADHIGYSLDGDDRQQFRETVSLSHGWDKIILVNPSDHTQAFEI